MSLKLAIYQEDLILQTPTIGDLHKVMSRVSGVSVARDCLVGYDEFRRTIISMGVSGPGVTLSKLILTPTARRLLELM